MDFLLPKDFHMLVQFIAGSHLYGTNTPQSDRDLRGVFIPDERYFYGFLHRTEQYEDKVNDRTYFEIRKFMKLALDNNPNIIEFLFVPEEKWIVKSKAWKMIVEARQLFLSKKAKFTFSGYAHSQLARIKRHRGWLLNKPKNKPERVDYGLPENRSLMGKEQIGAFNILLSMYLEDIREFHKLKDQIEEMEENHDFKTICQNMRRMDLKAVKTIMPISDNFLEALEREKAYMNAKREWDQYQNWKKNRNPERAALEDKFGYDTKHASHLFRLMYEGEELLETGHITFPRPDATLILAIRNGLWTYEKLMSKVAHYDLLFDKLYESSSLPRSPNKKEVDELCQFIVKSYIFV